MTAAADQPAESRQPRNDSRRSRTTSALLARAGEATGDEQESLLDEVVLANRTVAESLARRFRNRGIDDDDLRQVAYEALVKAVRRFDPSQDRDLLSYAVPTIRGELRRHFRDHGWMVRPTRAVQEAQWQIVRAREELAHELGRPPQREEIMRHLDLTAGVYDEAAAANGCFQPSSLDQPVDEASAVSLGDSLADDSDEHDAVEARAMVGPLLRKLSERERRIVYLRFYEDRSQAEIGEEVGVTQTQVSRLLTRTLSAMREELAPSE